MLINDILFIIMIIEVKVKYFYEKTDEDYEKYNKIYDKNLARIIFLHKNLSYTDQINNIKNDLNDNSDILSIRFPLKKEIKNNKIINNILLGNGIVCENNKVWYPKELWIYLPENSNEIV